MQIQKMFGLIFLLLTVAFTAGCSKKEETKVTTQVAARVNADEITVSQINAVLQRARNVPPEAQHKAQREILDKLIDQQLAKQAAIEKKLDRTPAVVQEIEAARDQILARAYLQQVAATQTKPSPETVKKYYGEHPELFAKRRIFSLEELLVQRAEGLAAKLQTQTAKAKSLQEIAAWLNSQNIKFAANRGVRPAEAIPLEMLPKLQTMRDGEIKLIEATGSLQIFQLTASKAAPVDLAKATPRIQQYLFNRGATDIAAAEMQRLKDKADITFMGEFTEVATAAAAAGTKANTATGAKAKSSAEARAQTEAAAQARMDDTSKARKAAEAQAQADAADRAQTRAKARRAAETQARTAVEAKAKSAPAKPALLPQDTIEKGLSGLK